MASDSSSNTTNTAADLMKQLRSHEVAIAELNNLPSSRAIYQQSGNLFFRTTAQTATTTEQMVSVEDGYMRAWVEGRQEMFGG